MRHLRPEGPHLPPPGLRGLQGAAEGDARRAGRPASRAQGCAGRHEYSPLRAGRLGGRRSDRHHRRQGYRRRVGNRDRHRRQGLPAVGLRRHPGQAGVHPNGADHHEGDDPGDLPGGLRLRPRPHCGLEGADGGHQRQHSRRQGHWGEDCDGSDPALPERGGHLRRRGGRGGQARGQEKAGRGGRTGQNVL